METTILGGLVTFAAATTLVGCTADIPTFDDDPKQELCGGAVCFAPEHVAVREWADGDVVVAAWADTGGCDLPRAGRLPVGGHAITIELKHARPGARLPIVAHDQPFDPNEGCALVHAIRVDAATGRALADEEGVSGEATVLDIDENSGALRVRVRARFSSGVSSETLVDVAGWPGCAAPAAVH